MGLGDNSIGIEDYEFRRSAFLKACHDLGLQIRHMAAMDDSVAVTWTATGTHQGEWLSIPATGKHVTWTGFNLLRTECGKIAQAWGESDHVSRLQRGSQTVPSTPVANEP